MYCNGSVSKCSLLPEQSLFYFLMWSDGKSGDAAELFERASQSIKVKHYTEALNDLNAAIEADPNLSESYLFRASVLRQLCRYGSFASIALLPCSRILENILVEWWFNFETLINNIKNAHIILVPVFSFIWTVDTGNNNLICCIINCISSWESL